MAKKNVINSPQNVNTNTMTTTTTQTTPTNSSVLDKILLSDLYSNRNASGFNIFVSQQQLQSGQKFSIAQSLIDDEFAKGVFELCINVFFSCVIDVDLKKSIDLQRKAITKFALTSGNGRIPVNGVTENINSVIAKYNNICMEVFDGLDLLNLYLYKQKKLIETAQYTIDKVIEAKNKISSLPNLDPSNNKGSGNVNDIYLSYELNSLLASKLIFDRNDFYRIIFFVERLCDEFLTKEIAGLENYNFSFSMELKKYLILVFEAMNRYMMFDKGSVLQSPIYLFARQTLDKNDIDEGYKVYKALISGTFDQSFINGIAENIKNIGKISALVEDKEPKLVISTQTTTAQTQTNQTSSPTSTNVSTKRKKSAIARPTTTTSTGTKVVKKVKTKNLTNSEKKALIRSISNLISKSCATNNYFYSNVPKKDVNKLLNRLESLSIIEDKTKTRIADGISKIEWYAKNSLITKKISNINNIKERMRNALEKAKSRIKIK